jgi:crotonobetainyl-CoA:carnitine CoA-transferase CaiB-like acyl-CoA transferase
MAPDLGRDTARVLADVLNLSEAEIAELAANGVTGARERGAKE